MKEEWGRRGRRRKRRVRKERKGRGEIRGQGGWREGVRVWRRRKGDKR